MKKIFLLTLVTALILPILVFASEVGGGPSYTLSADKVVQGNLYAGGGTVTVLGSISKDAMVGGGTVIINGPITANVMVAGGNVNVSGIVGQDLRVAGGTVLVSSSNIGGELVGAAGNLKVIEGARVAGDAYLAGGMVEIDGMIGGAARIAGGEVVINGTIGKDVTIRAQKVTLGPKAVISGNLNYQAQTAAKIDPAAKVTGQTVFKQIETKATTNPWVLYGLAWILKLVAFAIVALVVFFVIKKHSLRVSVLSVDNFWRELFRGLVILVVMPIAIILLFVSVVGWALALIGVFAYILIILLGGVFSIFTTTGLLQKYVFKKTSADITWPKLLLGALVLYVVSLIPIIGWIISFGIFLSALGSLAKLNFMTIRESRSGEVRD